MKKYFCPGRINLIGEHLDYNGGLVLPVAISLGITATVSRTKSSRVQFSSEGMPTVTLDVNDDWKYTGEDGWANYPKGVFMQFKHQYEDLRGGINIHYQSTLPMASGLSSSAAMEVLTMYILHDIMEEPTSKRSIALRCQQVENQFIGVNCGIMDQYAVANGTPNTAMLLDCSTATHTAVTFPESEYLLVVMNTCKPRRLVTSAYNERRAECEAALALIQSQFPISSLAAATQAQVDACVKDAILHKRATHVVTEQARVIEAAAALQKGDFLTLGNAMNASHHSLRYDYEVSGTELDTLVALAQAQPGCIGARMTGAGFGGCAIAWVSAAHYPDFATAIPPAYEAQIGYPCELYVVEVVAGVGEVIAK